MGKDPDFFLIEIHFLEVTICHDKPLISYNSNDLKLTDQVTIYHFRPWYLSGFYFVHPDKQAVSFSLYIGQQAIREMGLTPNS